MNLSTIALLLLAWQLLGNSSTTGHNASPSAKPGLTDFLSDDTKNMLDCVNKLSSAQCSQEDKTSAIFQMMANPAVMNIASNLFSKNTQANSESEKKPPEQSVHTQKAEEEHVNSEGYRFETPSDFSQEFFRPIENIADTEVKHKLYYFYDNWYIK